MPISKLPSCPKNLKTDIYCFVGDINGFRTANKLVISGANSSPI
jgi:hypothetical protein